MCVGAGPAAQLPPGMAVFVLLFPKQSAGTPLAPAWAVGECWYIWEGAERCCTGQMGLSPRHVFLGLKEVWGLPDVLDGIGPV